MMGQKEGTAEELSRTREACREFIFHAIHDLREPLRTIGTSAELVCEEGACGASERAKECLGYLRDGVGRMDSLLRDIANYCDGEGRCLQLKEISLAAALVEAKRQIGAELAKNGASLTHERLPDVTGDLLALATVFRNLIENACKFRGPNPLAVHVAVIPRKAEWEVSVQDNGLGFEPVYADIIFQPFKRLHGRKYPGSGLGLPLAKRIIEQHGGRMGAEARVGEGSTFWFTLPVPD